MRQGLARGTPLDDSDMRHLALYYDCRVAHSIPLIMHLANVRMRHDVNKSVAARVLSSPGAFAKFEALVNDPSFRTTLEAAVADPKGKEAEEVFKTVLSFVQLSGSNVRWGSRERAGEITRHMALCRYSDHGSTFTSYAPDDVHEPLVIRYAHPTTSPTAFPNLPPADFEKALRAPTDAERHVGEFDMREATLQTLAYHNPVATSAIFHTRADQVVSQLVGHDPSLKASVRLDSKPAGVVGVSAYWADATECNKRDSQHLHGKGGGSLSPTLLSDIAAYPKLRKVAFAALDSQVRLSVAHA